jgi:short-subunit dehydrogenase
MKAYTLITGACINTGVAIVEKFASEGRNVVFTGRSPEKVAAAQEAYRAKFPEVDIIGYAIDSLLDERTVDEASVAAMFAYLDERDIYAETLVLNAADQGLGSCILGWLDDEAIRRICNLNGTVRLVITLGYAREGDALRPKKRKAPEELIQFIE